MRRCGGNSSLRIFAVSRRRSRRIGTELAERVKPYDGLYAPEDFLWSAPRPLPRGWVPMGDALLPADMVFWDGARAIAIELSARETEKQKALAAAGVSVCRIEPGMFDRLGEVLPSTSCTSGKARRCRRAHSAALSRGVSCHCDRPLVIASGAKQSPSRCAPDGDCRVACAPRNDNCSPCTGGRCQIVISSTYSPPAKRSTA